jgi:hypothetical protein
MQQHKAISAACTCEKCVSKSKLEKLKATRNKRTSEGYKPKDENELVEVKGD